LQCSPVLWNLMVLNIMKQDETTGFNVIQCNTKQYETGWINTIHNNMKWCSKYNKIQFDMMWFNKIILYHALLSSPYPIIVFYSFGCSSYEADTHIKQIVEHKSIVQCQTLIWIRFGSPHYLSWSGLKRETFLITFLQLSPLTVNGM